MSPYQPVDRNAYRHKECPGCKNIFKPTIGMQKFCNKDCRYNYFKEKNKNSYIHVDRTAYPEIKCPTCKIVFKPSHGKQMYCNSICRPTYQRGPRQPIRACEFCEKAYQPYGQANQKYCSRTCKLKAREIRRRLPDYRLKRSLIHKATYVSRLQKFIRFCLCGTGPLPGLNRICESCKKEKIKTKAKEKRQKEMNAYKVLKELGIEF